MFDAELLKARRGRAENPENSWKFSGAGAGGRRSCAAKNGAARKQGYAGRLKSRSDAGEDRRNGFPFGALKVNDREPRHAGLPGQLSLSDAEERAACAAHLRGKD